jgi:DNA-directed RNA polymerase subunit RPC12/RpoP
VFLFYIAVGVVVLIAIVLHASAACPSCGLQLVEGPLDRLGQKDRMDHCRHCGWKRRR